MSRNLEVYLKVDEKDVHVGTFSHTPTVGFGGKLVYKNDYSFYYSKEFQASDLPPIREFGDKEAMYYFKGFMPEFFKVRIPSLKRPEVKEVILAEAIDSTDTWELLARFGGKTITSPYELRDWNKNP